ncbi:MAG: TPM domain-containing protein [Bacteroidota bacterium]
MKNKLILAFSCLLLAIQLFAKDIPPAPNPPRLVNDYAGALSGEEQAALETKLNSYFKQTSTQITVVIENTLDGDDAFSYSQKLAQAWGIGEKGKSNGILLYFAIADRKVWFQVGYGLEGAMTDAMSKRIINNNIKPNFKEQAYYQGINEATDNIIKVIAGEGFTNDRKAKRHIPWGLIGVVVVFIIISLLKGKGGRRGGGGGGGIAEAILWGTLASGGFSGRNNGGGGFGGGSSSGGFGGFGGGSFGGGGAGGDW